MKTMIFSPLLLLLLARPASAGVEFESGLVIPGIDECIPMQTWLPYEEAGSLNNVSFADLSNLDAADVDSFCRGDGVSGDRLEGQLITSEGISLLCGLPNHGEYFPGVVRNWLTITEGAKGAAFLMIPVGDAEKKFQKDYHPGLTSNFDYVNLVPEGDPAYPTPQRPAYMCGFMKGFWDGLGPELAELGTIHGVNVSDIRVSVTGDENFWDELFQSWYYQLNFTVIIPAASLYIAWVAHTALRRMEEAKKKKNQGKKAPLTITSLVLMIERVVLPFAGINYMVTGLYARRAPFWYHCLGTFMFAGQSMGTTLLTAIFWSDLRSDTENMRTGGGGKSLMQRRGVSVILSVLFGLFADYMSTAGALFRNKGVVVLIILALSTTQVTVAVWFFKEIRRAMKLLLTTLNALAKKSNEKGGGSKNNKGNAMQERMTRAAFWLQLSSYAMFFNVAVLLGLGGTQINYSSHGTFIVFSNLVNASRLFSSYSQIMAVAPPPPKPGKGGRNKVQNTTTASSSNSTSANSVADSTAASSVVDSTGASSSVGPSSGSTSTNGSIARGSASASGTGPSSGTKSQAGTSGSSVSDGSSTEQSTKN